MAVSVPFGVGLKYSLNERLNIGFEIVHRFTNTDYLDDVSTTYVDPSVFPPNPDGTPCRHYCSLTDPMKQVLLLEEKEDKEAIVNIKTSLLQQFFT